MRLASVCFWGWMFCCGLGNAFGYEAQILFLHDSGPFTPILIKEQDCVACRFHSEIPFQQLVVVCPSYDDAIGRLSMTLYRWEETLEKTLASVPIKKKTFVNFLDNSHLEFPFPAQEAGEYLLTFSDTQQKVGVWMSQEKVDGVSCWMNGQPMDGTFQIAISNTNAPIPFFGSRKTFLKVLNHPTCPAEKPAESLPFAVRPDTFAAVDELGRTVPVSETDTVRPGKTVGIFYWTWHHLQRGANDRVYNNAQIIREHPEVLQNPDHPAWGPWRGNRHWDEPLLGYYSTDDRWVLRRHAQWLANAGIDVVVFDCTNGIQLWSESTLAVLETFSEARQDGVNAPKMAFMLPFHNVEWIAPALRKAYREIYQPGKFQELWFYWQGRPLVLANSVAIDRMIASSSGEEKAEWEAIRCFFTFRPPQASYTIGPVQPDQWSWLEIYPQHGFVPKSDGRFEMVSVGVAQNHSEHKSDGTSGLAAMNDTGVFGRAHQVGKPVDTRENAFYYGGNFAQQWGRALEIDPDFVFVTGWNEWIAGRGRRWCGLHNAFPDQYNPEFSRDTEPSAGVLRDHFYNQLVGFVRQFKGIQAVPKASAEKTISFPSTSDAGDAWADVEPTYYDYRRDTAPRDADGYPGEHYTNRSGRNDIVSAKVARDAENVYFLVETAEPLTDRTGANWMQLFLSTGDLSESTSAKTPNWNGFQFLVNRIEPGETAVLERSTGGWNWTEVCKIEYHVQNNRLEMAIPRKFLGLDANKDVSLRFKWVDNAFGPESNDILDFYRYGDAAPDGRFQYVFQGQKTHP